jgi:hypothetical protein
MTDGQSLRLFVEALLEFMARILSMYRAVLSVRLGALALTTVRVCSLP